MITKTTPLGNWAHRARLTFTRNWKAKLLALVLAFLFWQMVKGQIADPGRSFVDKHSLRESSGL